MTDIRILDTALGRVTCKEEISPTIPCGRGLELAQPVGPSTHATSESCTTTEDEGREGEGTKERMEKGE
eukprot:8123889-Alexandrium_andersonii.AAC.1